jgi:hypothetical protein
LLSCGHGNRIVGFDFGATRLESRNNLERWRVAHIVGIGLKRQSQDANGFVSHSAAYCGNDLLDHVLPLLPIDPLHGRCELQIDAGFLGKMH